MQTANAALPATLGVVPQRRRLRTKTTVSNDASVPPAARPRFWDGNQEQAHFQSSEGCEALHGDCKWGRLAQQLVQYNICFIKETNSLSKMVSVDARHNLWARPTYGELAKYISEDPDKIDFQGQMDRHTELLCLQSAGRGLSQHQPTGGH